jgi:trans-2-enoyl-CoA reductase
MQALQQIAYGDPAEVIRLVEVDEPVPGPDEILIEVEAAAMHLADLKFINGDPGFRWFEMPRWPGHEGIGRVVARGSQVDAYGVGDRVFLPIGAGTFRQRVPAAASACMPAPEGDVLQLALTSLNGLTASILVDDIAQPIPGEWLIQNGANSSCGRFVIALAKERGAKTVNIVRRSELVDEMKAAGADAVVVDTGDPDTTAALVREATGDAGIRYGFDCVAATGTVTIARCLADQGTVINYGFMSGKNAEMAFEDMFGKRISLEGMGRRTVRSAWERRDVLDRLAAMTADGRLQAKIAGTFTLAQAQDAFALQAKTGTERPGKVIILPNA